MNHRTLGRTGLTISEIGLGTEFLLGLSEDDATGVIRAAIDGGMTYIDMFWSQPEFRDHMGAALRGCRDQVVITAHLGSTLSDGQYAVSRDPKLCAEFFEDYLRRMETDYVDVLFLHNCNKPDDYETVMAPGGPLDLARSFMKAGKARFIGFSGHNVVTAKQAVESGAIDVLMFPINLASYAVPGKPEVLRACAEHDVGLVAMKVFGGGSLLRDKATIEIDDFQMGRQQMEGAPSHYAAPKKITPVQCIAYALDRPELSTIVPGCKSIAELDETLAYYEADAAARDYTHILPAFAEFATGECVYCNHCLPCPSRIDIGQTISLLEQARFEMTDELRTAYTAMETDASDCIQCAQCAERCPFGVDVITKMAEAVSLFACVSESLA